MPQHFGDYSHLAPNLSGNERLDVAVAAVAQAASAAAAAAAAAVIQSAGEHIRAHLQVGTNVLSIDERNGYVGTMKSMVTVA